MKVHVVSKNRYIGIVSESADPQSFKFVYSDDVSSDDYILGLHQKENISNYLFPIFDDLIPENKDKLDAIKASHSIKNTIGILLHLDNIHGSFEFYRDVKDIPQLNNQGIIQFNDVKFEILGDYAYPEILDDYNLVELPENNYSTSENTTLGLSGYQEKHAVLKDDINHVVTYAGKTQSEYFIKPFNIDFSNYNKAKMRFNTYKKHYYPYLLINEHIFMSLAKDFGFDVPYNGLIKDPNYNEYHLIVKRFDRYQTTYKFDHHTVNSFLGNIATDKYHTTVTDIIKGIQEKISSDDMLVLFKFIVFSIIISHGDLHAKNLSLIYCSNEFSDKKMRLAPMYDVLTTNIYHSSQNKNDIGIKINNKLSNIRSSDLLYIAEIMNISNIIAKKIIDDFCNKFLSSFEAHINKLPDKIKTLRIKASDYKDITLSGRYAQYLNNRKAYIEKYLVEKPAEKNIF